MKTAAIVLAGGQSRRFGTPKALAEWKGRPFLSYTMEAAAAADEAVIITHLGELHAFGRCVPDLPTYQGQGPLAGMLSGMTAVEAEWYVVLPCDAPRITREVVETLLSRTEDVQAVVPVISGRQQPLIAIYHHSIRPVLEEQLQQGELRLTSLLERITVRYVTEGDLQIEAAVFLNVNTQENYREL